MKTAWRFLKRHGRRLVAVGITGAVFVLWIGLFCRAIRCWPRASLDVLSGTYLVDISNDARVLITTREVHDAYQLSAWDCDSHSTIITIADVRRHDPQIRLTSDGRYLAIVMDRDRPEIDLYDVATKQRIATIPAGETGGYEGWPPPAQMAFSADGRTLLHTVRNFSGDKSLQVWDIAAGRPRVRFGDHLVEEKIALSADGTTAVAFGLGPGDGGRFVLPTNRGTIRIWSTQDGSLRKTIHTDFHPTVFVSSDGTQIGARWEKAEGGPYDPLRLTDMFKRWDLNTGEELVWRCEHLWIGRTDRPVIVRDDGDQMTIEDPMAATTRQLVACQALLPGTPLPFWHLWGPAGSEDWVCQTRTEPVDWFEWWDSNGLTGLFWRGEFRSDFYRAETGSFVATISSDKSAVSADGTRLATMHSDKTVAIWDLPLRRPAGLILLLAFLHTALILAPCWWFARRRTAEAAA